MTKQNQGFLKNLNLEETPNETIAIDNLAGAGTANDLRIIQNNLRNISTVSYNILSNGFFSYPNNEFVFTNDDIVGVNKNVNVGATNLITGTEYFVCNSNGETQFKLSTTSSTLGINTIVVSSVSPTDFYFIRKDFVTEENIVNYIQPDIQDTEGFSYLGGVSINDTVKGISVNNETTKYFIEKKYRIDEDRTIPKDIKFEGTVIITDPVALNVNSTGLSNSKSPGVFIGDTRAFSSDNNPWSEVSSSLQTSSTEVSVGELNFDNESGKIIIEGITPDTVTSALATTYTHKLPVVINGETYYILLRT
jgi:hypothetical protein